MKPDQRQRWLARHQTAPGSQFDGTGMAQPTVVQWAAAALRRPGPGRRAKGRPAPTKKTTSSARRRAILRRWRRRLVLLLAMILVISLGGTLAYGLLLAPPPTNILILGMDRRPEEGNAVRTDTILLLHADPLSRQLVLLSIPRDLWVTIPGRGEARINTAHVYGELEAPGGGPARTAETIHQNFGLAVDRTLRMDFDAFREVIDAAGGIEIDVPNPILDNAYPTEDYGTMRIQIAAGSQHMDSETALQYARSRFGSSDFDRAARQQLILIALTKKLSRPSGWLQIPGVFQAFQNAVETDVNVLDLARLALAWVRAGQDGLETIVIDQALTIPFRTSQGADVLQPRWELIQPLIQTQFGP